MAAEALSEQLGYDTRRIHARHAKRQLELEIEDAGGFVDEHYPTWYGADFSNVRIQDTCQRRFRALFFLCNPTCT